MPYRHSKRGITSASVAARAAHSPSLSGGMGVISGTTTALQPAALAARSPLGLSSSTRHSSVFTVWVTRFIHFPIRERMFLNHSLRAFQKKKAEKTNLICIQGLNDLLRRLSQANAKCIKASVQTWTFIRASFTVCLTCRWNCIHLCSQSQESPVGRLTELKNLSIRVKSFVPHIKVSQLIKNMSLLTTEIKNKLPMHCIGSFVLISIIHKICNFINQCYVSR